jgi:hypothetical protein
MAVRAKYDGFRGLLYLPHRECVLYSNRGNRMTRFRDLAEQIRAELPRRDILAARSWPLITKAVSTSGPNARTWDSGLRSIDLLWINGRDLRGLPLTQRKKRLERLIPAAVGALTGCHASRRRAANYWRARVVWTWRGLWRSGKPTSMARTPPGTWQLAMARISLNAGLVTRGSLDAAWRAPLLTTPTGTTVVATSSVKTILSISSALWYTARVTYFLVACDLGCPPNPFTFRQSVLRLLAAPPLPSDGCPPPYGMSREGPCTPPTAFLTSPLSRQRTYNPD